MSVLNVSCLYNSPDFIIHFANLNQQTHLNEMQMVWIKLHEMAEVIFKIKWALVIHTLYEFQLHHLCSFEPIYEFAVCYIKGCMMHISAKDMEGKLTCGVICSLILALHCAIWHDLQFWLSLTVCFKHA